MFNRAIRNDAKAQTALADAIIALIIISIASAVIYSAVAITVSSSSDTRQRVNLRTAALQSAGLPLEASYPNVSFTNLSSGKVQVLINISGEQIFMTMFELKAHSIKTGDSYNISAMELAIRDLYLWALEGRSYAVRAQGTVKGQNITMLFSSELINGKDTLDRVELIPHPRVVTQKAIHGGHGEISVDLYLWK